MTEKRLPIRIVVVDTFDNLWGPFDSMAEAIKWTIKNHHIRTDWDFRVVRPAS